MTVTPTPEPVDATPEPTPDPETPTTGFSCTEDAGVAQGDICCEVFAGERTQKVLTLRESGSATKLLLAE